METFISELNCMIIVITSLAVSSKSWILLISKVSIVEIGALGHMAFVKTWLP